MVEVIVKLTPSGAQPDSAEYRGVQECASRLGVSLERLHPSTSDPDLATYAVTHVDAAKAHAVLEQLLECSGVEGAYAKPPGEPP